MVSFTAMSGIMNPESLALPHELEYYADEAIQEESLKYVNVAQIQRCETCM